MKTMRDLVILGGGVHSAEMVEIVERINRVEPTWNLLGYLTPHEEQIGTSRNGYPVLGRAEALDAYPDACLVADNEWPRSIPAHQERLVSLVDPSAVVSRTARIGAGCVLYPHCFVGLNARIGDMVFCLSGSIINHDDVIGDRVVIASGVTLAGSVVVEEGCYLGQSCTVRQHVRIGQGSLIGMGAVVVKEVAAGSVIVGNPGRRLRGNGNGG
jgi:sugar O-acyltransferase (sialic acid O-acetyltransferase NeuD family)